MIISVEPKPLPDMVTAVPGLPLVGEVEVMTGCPAAGVKETGVEEDVAPEVMVKGLLLKSIAVLLPFPVNALAKILYCPGKAEVQLTPVVPLKPAQIVFPSHSKDEVPALFVPYPIHPMNGLFVGVALGAARANDTPLVNGPPSQ